MFRMFRRFRYWLIDWLDAFFSGRWFSRFFQTRSLMGAISDFFFGLRGGRWKHLLLGLPALLVVVGTSYVFGRTYMNQRAVAERYYQAALAARDAGDHDKAYLCLERVLAEDSALKKQAQYEMAVLIEDSGQIERAAALFQTLAPDDSVGNPAAHRRFAIILSNKMNPNTSIDEIERWHWHLKNALDKKSPAMSMAWGRYHLMTGDFKQASEFFESASSEFPQLYQVIGDLNARLGRREASLGAYTKAVGYLQTQSQANPADAETRINHAQCLMRLGEFGLARKALLDGKQHATDDSVAWDTLLSMLHVNYHDLLTSRGAKLTELLGALNAALRFDPNNGAALKRLMSYSKANVEGNVELRRILAGVLATGESSPMAHLAMGNLCWIEGDREQAKFHFGQAQAGADNMPVVLNNLAWVLADDDPPDCEQALVLVEQSLKLRPDDPNFLDTRGTIYMKMEQWQKALTDLEAALASITDKASVHRKLAEVYDHLGIPEVAEEHRRLSGTPKTPVSTD
jgi:tetratricopeptide (TPR) repeat protein